MVSVLVFMVNNARIILEDRGMSSKIAYISSRRLMSIWHTIHIPIGVALFTTAFIHIGAAIYYATLLR